VGVPPALRPLLVNAVELRRQPGASRQVATAIDPEELGCESPVPGVRLSGQVGIDLTATSGADDIGVTGSITLTWIGPCRRCLSEVERTVDVEIAERFVSPGHPAVDERADGTTVIEGDQIDLAPIIRDVAVLELPAAPLCREECRGWCPQCGAELSTDSCGCETERRDPRWAALDGVVLDDSD
jgi:uncharacterized protein